ncbi:methyl-accepting chemotaxis protein [Pseudorhodoplanes sp.]|uniref:methyl-accepting chemotaxis protein n=1 Tax=Pseudorhodoplanes sp. TaxID=1934341 RepID=UPI002CF4E567|nr:methyl-accepting chemotaxis protein [Pseudorhodoplanes sp.]HWV52020.1 methyl-accepting chemotaxis protein [Pseudorhodoplanes sp.]
MALANTVASARAPRAAWLSSRTLILVALVLQAGAAIAFYVGNAAVVPALGACALAMTALSLLWPSRSGSLVAGSGQDGIRIAAALEACRTNVMVADENYNIVYMNQTMTEMLAAAESDLRKDIPALSARNMIGASIDTFHRNPSHQRRILDGLTATTETDISVGGRSFHLIVTPIFDDRRRRIGTVVEWKDETQQKATELVNFRLRSALDVCKTNVMVADDRYDIVYMNQTMDEMLRNAEADVRKDIPSFNASRMIGVSIDTFHKNPAHQRRMLDALTSTVETDIKVGGRNFHLVVTPVRDGRNQRIGTVVEWRDETAEKLIEAEIDRVVSAAVAGDLTMRVGTEGKSGFMLGLANSMNALCDRFREFVREIGAAASEVSNASSEISLSTADLSQRTEEQAASLEQTSASMEEMSATVKKNAENAQRANEFATGACEVAGRGGDVVAQAVSAMSRIEESSGKISDIISVIDEIARQTNLLALNAAVEAARAGEAGRGFAVVASEVRNLAQRSSQAAKDIKDLINGSTGHVRDGVELVGRAGNSLDEILDSIRRVAAIVSDIAVASAEQSTGIEQVNRAMSQMDEITQQNSALVEENAATAKTLEQQAASMHERVSAFRLAQGAAAEPARAPVTNRAPVKLVRGGASQPVARQRSAGRSQAALAAREDWEEF